MIELSDGTASLPAGPAAGVVLPIPRATERPAFCTCAFISFPPFSSGKGSFLHVLLPDAPCSLQPGGEKGEGRLTRLGRSLCCARSCPPAPAASLGCGDERAAAVGGAGTPLQGAGTQRFTPRSLHPPSVQPGSIPLGPFPLPTGPRLSPRRQPLPSRGESPRSGEKLHRERSFRPTRRRGGLAGFGSGCCWRGAAGLGPPAEPGSCRGIFVDPILHGSLPTPLPHGRARPAGGGPGLSPPRLGAALGMRPGTRWLPRRAVPIFSWPLCGLDVERRGSALGWAWRRELRAGP